MAQLHTPTSKEVIVLVGPPSAGKSTYAKTFPSHYVISVDQFLELWSRESGRKYEDIWEERIKDAEKLMWTTFASYLKSGVPVIVDMTNMGRKKRKNLLRNIPKDYFKKVVAFELPREELERRYKKRIEEGGKNVPWEIIESMLNRYERPELAEGWQAVEIRCE